MNGKTRVGLMILAVLTLAPSSPKIRLVASKDLGQEVIAITFDRAQRKDVVASIYCSQISDALPGHPWIWDETQTYFIYSAFEGDMVYLPDYLPEMQVDNPKRDELRWMIPEKQVLYLVDVSSETITRILELGPQDIYTICQYFYRREGRIYFRANKNYVIDVERKTAIEVEK